MRLPRAKMANDMNAQAASQTEQDTGKRNQQLTNATDMMSELSSMLPDSEDANYMMKAPSRDLPNLPTLPSLPTSISPAFYTTPTITRALQQMPAAMPVSPPTFWSFSDSPNPDQDTPESDYNTAKSFRDNQIAKLSSNDAFTCEIPHQKSSKDPNYTAGPSLRAHEESSDLEEQATIRQQKEKDAGARVISTGMFQAGSLVSDPRLMSKMLELQEAQLERKDRELAAAQKSNTQLRTRLSDMEDELARVQAKVKQKNIYISACDKKIDALQKKIALLTRPYTGPTVEKIRTDTEINVNAESQLHKPTSKPKTISIPPAQPSGEARLKGVSYEAPSEERKASSIRACEQSLRRQAELEGRYMLSARSEKRRRVAKGYLWGDQEPSKNNGELREELIQARAANNFKPGHVSVCPEVSEGALGIVSQQEISETATSHSEADRVKDTEGEGHEDTGQRANSLLSQKSSYSSDWENVEGIDLEKEWPYAWW
ncbi:hypothetical protein KCU95_g7116, partial [Aureobasidium melanogenum]